MATEKDQPARLPLELNPALGVPIYRQVMEGIRRMIAGGLLKPGDRLPSIRDLSVRLRINPSSAVKAYDELQHLGVISLDHGRGTFVADDRTLAAKSRAAVLDQELDRLIQAAKAMGLEADEVADRLKTRFRTGPAGQKKPSRPKEG